MHPTVVQIENVSKRYRIGGMHPGYMTFREMVGDAIAAPLRRLRRTNGDYQISQPQETCVPEIARLDRVRKAGPEFVLPVQPVPHRLLPLSSVSRKVPPCNTARRLRCTCHRPPKFWFPPAGGAPVLSPPTPGHRVNVASVCGSVRVRFLDGGVLLPSADEGFAAAGFSVCECSPSPDELSPIYSPVL